MREYLVRMLYCELLGHQASFGYFFAVTLTSAQKIMDKRMGYLATSLCLPKDHELVLLLTHNMQKDLKSSNQLEISSALTAASKIITEETIPALLPSVLDLKTHHFPLVRKKAYMFIHSAYRSYPELIANPLQHAKDGLADRDPSVMGASLNLLYEIVIHNPNHPDCKSLVEILVSILKQIVDHRLSSTYDYHRLPAPWIQMKILSIFSILGKDDKNASELMYDILSEVMRRADIGLNIGHAIVFETIRTISTIYPMPELLELAASGTARFMQSKNQNLKYLGIQALTIINNPRYANQHQSTVIDCLEDKDETIKRSTLSLLYTMTNDKSVTVITNKLLEFARKEIEKKFQEELIFKICSLAEKYAPDNFWYIDTINDCFEVDAGLVPQDAILTLMTVVAEGSGEDLTKDEELRVYTVEVYFELLQEKPVLHDVHIQVIAWILGEYGYLSKKYSQEDIILALCDVAERRLEDNYTRSRICSALLKLTAQVGKKIPQVMKIINKYLNSKDTDLQQRCYEFSSLIEIDTDFQLMNEILPIDGSCQEIDVDLQLRFTDNYVKRALNVDGALKYLKEEEREFTHIEFQKPQLKIEYENSQSSHILPFTNPNLNPVSNENQIKVESQKNPITHSDNELKIAFAKKVWFDDDDEDISLEKDSVSPSTPSINQQQQINTFNSSLNSGNPNLIQSQPIFQGMASNNYFTNPQPSNVVNISSTKVSDEDIKKPSKKTTELVNAIFGGEGNTKRAGVRNKRQIDNEQNQVNLIGDPFEFDSNNTIQQKSQPTVKKQIEENLFDFGDILGGTEQDLNQESLPIQKNTLNSDDIYNEPDLIMDSQITQNSQNEWEIPTLSPSSNKSLQSTQKFAFNPGNDPIVQSLIYKSKYISEPITLFNDILVEATEQKFRTNDNLSIVLVIQSKQGQRLTNINAEFQPPAKFHIDFESGLSFTLSKNNLITFRTLEPTLPITIVVKFKVEDFGFGTNVMGSISYTDNHKQSHSNTINIGINVLDILRPHSMDAKTFGRNWATHTKEKRIVIPHQGITVDKLKKLLDYNLQLNIIQVIDNELIASGIIVNLNSPILVHATSVNANNIVFTVRSLDILISSSISSSANKILSLK